ncbi:TldD/PmbA family protein [bacterium]|nr:TldD/PmbA family protein [bacterium]
MQEILDAAMNVANKRKAQYADIRLLTRTTQSLTVRDGRVETINSGSDAGIGVRVIHKGRWGFAASRDISAAEAANVCEQALRIAEASASGPGTPVVLDDTAPQKGEYATPMQRDPFEVSLEEKLGRLFEADSAMAGQAGLSHRGAFFDIWREDQHFASSEGARIHQVITECGGGILATALREGDKQVRCYPNSFRGQFHTAGYEAFLDYDIVGEGPRVAEEAVRLLDSPPVPSGECSLILDGPQLALQIHESIGHPLELDRVLGFEAAFAGMSFVKPEDIGSLRYGSELLNITVDPTLPGGLGSYAYDDDGVPTRRDPVIVNGVLQGFLTSRETAPVIGAQSNACNRADGFGRLPLVRMPNVNLEPGPDGVGLEELISGVKDGFLFSNNRSWSIDDKRVNFQFGCEAAYEIKDGRLTGRLFKNPTYTGITTEFWAGLSGVCGPQLWRIWGTPNCGKGQPSQTAHVAHGCSPSRFENVRVGVRA